MPNLSTISLTINGKKVKFDNFTLNTSVMHHHELSVITDAQDLGDNSGTINADEIMEFIGKPIYLKVARKDGDKNIDLVFNGIVTNINLSKGKDSYDRITIIAKSRTILADNQWRVASNIGTLKQVIERALSDFTEMVKISISDNPQIDYCCQYNETPYHFVQRMCNLYGLWCYFDGDKLVIGDYEETNKVSAELGIDIADTNLDLSIKRLGSGTFSYDYIQNDTYKVKAKDIKIQESDSYGENLKDRSKEVFDKSYSTFSQHSFHQQSELEKHAEKQYNKQSANLVVIEGKGKDPLIKIGAKLTIKSSGNTFGTYHIVSAEYKSDFLGHLSVVFKGIPANIKVPFPNHNITYPQTSKQIASVVDNEDPKKIGRIKIKFPWQKSEDDCPWVRVVFPYSGGGGIYFVPEKEDQVIVDFEYGNPNRPIVTGSLVHKDSIATTHFFNLYEKNAAKLIVSKEGHQIKLIEEGDNAGIYLYTKDKQLIIIEDSGKILIESKGEISLISKKITLSADDIYLDAKQSIELNAMSIKIEGKTEVGIKATQTKVEGDATTTIKGGLVQIN